MKPLLSRHTERVPTDPKSVSVCARNGETIVSDAHMNAHMAAVSLPLQTCTTPMMMMSASASSLPAVNMSCTLVAHLTLEQFTHVSSTNKREAHSYKSRTALIQPILKIKLSCKLSLISVPARSITLIKLCYLGCFCLLLFNMNMQATLQPDSTPAPSYQDVSENLAFSGYVLTAKPRKTNPATYNVTWPAPT